MPNHVTNRLIAACHVIDAIWNEDADDGKGAVDFNRMIPQPAIIAKYDSVPSHVELAAEISLGLIDFRSAFQRQTLDFSDGHRMVESLHASNAIRQLIEGRFVKDFSADDFEMFVDFMRAKRDYGSCNWYQWNIANWGTKWGAYTCTRTAASVEFDTAWSHPKPVIDKLASLFPGERIVHLWADEDTGSNVGRREYGPNGVTETIPESQSREAYDMCFALNPNSKEYYRLNEATGNYEYHEEEEATA